MSSRFDNAQTITRLTQESRVDDLQQIHTGILLSTRLLNEASGSGEPPARKGLTMSEKSIVQEARDIQLAMELITLGDSR